MKKLAIHLYGHLRTFQRTKDNFYKNLIEPNKKNYEIDIFIHTYDVLCAPPHLAHPNGAFDGLVGEPIDLELVKDIYKPIAIEVGHLNEGEFGMYKSMKRVHELRHSHELNSGGGGVNMIFI